MQKWEQPLYCLIFSIGKELKPNKRKSRAAFEMKATRQSPAVRLSGTARNKPI